MDKAEKTLSFIAYHTSVGEPPPLIPGPTRREWMQNTNESFANRCLPLLLANQHGWFVLSPHTVHVQWDGSDSLAGVRIEHVAGPEPYLAMSHFGHGILTFSIPFLFRTPPGYNLLVRGPANMPKDGVYPLEGIVETDWTTATFTMNWRLTRTHHKVTFDIGEPIAMLVPVRRADLDAFEPEIQGIHDDPEEARAFFKWRQSRAQFIDELPLQGTQANRTAWQKDYVRGRTPDGTVAREHQLKLALRPFKRPAQRPAQRPTTTDHRPDDSGE